MKDQRLRSKLFQCWLHPKEVRFLNRYAKKNLSTSSDIFRGWLHEVMKREGFDLKEPLLPENK